MRPALCAMPDSMKKWKQIKEIFNEALELEGSERLRFVKAECSGDDEMLNEVLSLLNAHEQKGALDQTMNDVRLSAISDATRNHMKGEVIGKYRIIKQLGYGGMGTVFLAERADGEFEQQVAIKLLRNTFAGEDQIQRFKSERQILASLNHDNIARLLDGGLTRHGQPFYVMEYVEGTPIDDYCREHKLNIEERLELFLDICAAVQYAHNNLIVHRDLKPTNILVTKDGRVKLLDFGIAKVLGDEPAISTETPLTRPGLLPLTPTYASPEQIRGEPITTASDIYQLGLVLYELLTGTRPFNLGDKTPGQIEQIVCETKPVRPSTAVLNAEQPPSKGEKQSPGWSKQLKGDLDIITLMALNKEPERRYNSAEQFSGDIKNYLAGHPVTAYSDSKFYRSKKFIGRHKAGTVSVTAIIVLIIAYAISVTHHSQQTQAALEQAREETEKSEQVVDFVMGMFEAGDPRSEHGDQITARELIERGLDEANRLDNQPELQANMFSVIGRVYTSLGRYEDASEILAEAVEIKQSSTDEPGTELAYYLQDYGYALARSNLYEESLNKHKMALEIIKDIFGERHPEVAEAMLKKAFWVPVAGMERVYELRKEALDIRLEFYGDNHLATADALMKLGQIYRSKAKPMAAIESYSKALEIRESQHGIYHPDVAESMIFLGNINRLYEIDTEKAESLYRQALYILNETLNFTHKNRLHALTSLAGLLSEQGNHEESIELYRENLEIRKDIYGEIHPSIAEGKGQLATGFRRMGKFEKAEKYYTRSLELWIDLMGPNHNVVSGALIGMGNLMTKMERYDEAKSYLKRALDIRRNHFGENAGALILGDIGRMYRESENFDEARFYYEKAISLFDSAEGSVHYDVRQLKNEFEEFLTLVD